MLRWAFLFLILAVIAGSMGFGMVAGFAYDAAKVLFFVFLVLFVASIVVGSSRAPRDVV